MATMLAMAVSYGMNDDRVSWHLWNWSRWMQFGSHRLGYPKRASGGLQGNGTVGEFDDECHVADVRCARATDAVIESLPPAQKMAVHHKHLASVFRMPRSNIETAYDLACSAIARGLDRRGIV